MENAENLPTQVYLHANKLNLFSGKGSESSGSKYKTYDVMEVPSQPKKNLVFLILCDTGATV